MARSRNLKPAFFTNEVLAENAPLGRLLFAGLWCHADRDGRLEDRPKRLKAEILPYDQCDVDALLQALHEGGFIYRYAVDGQRFIQVVSFRKHQNPHCKEAASSIPAPDKYQASPVLAPWGHGANLGNSGTSPADSFNPLMGSLNPLPKPHRSPPDADSLPDGFAEFWQAYPRKVSKPQAIKAWRKLKPDTQTHTAILAGLERDRRSDQWLRDGGQFIPHPATWLNGRRWEDDTLNAAQPEFTPWEHAI